MNKASGSAHIEQAAKAFRSMGHPVRLEILLLLERKKTLSVGEIQKALRLSQSMTSQHLQSMRSNNILSADKHDNKVYYKIANRSVVNVISCMQKCQGRGREV